MLNHLRQNWHRHLAAWGTTAALAILLTGIGAGAAIALHFRGGFRPGGTMPPVITISGGSVPSSVSLAASIVRIHNQGDSSSCVGQTLSTLGEIAASEAGMPASLSAGFIYDQANGGSDNGTTWQAAFGILTGEGDAPLPAFPHDGQDWWVQPDRAAIAAARVYRFRSWRSIDPMDIHTIKAELAAGRPLGLAIPVHDTFYNHGCTSPLTADTGAFHFWHAVTVIGYNPTGIRILNSWGPGWGCSGQGTIAWPLLAAYAAQGASIVVGIPQVRPEPTPKPTPIPARTPEPQKTPIPIPAPTATLRPPMPAPAQPIRAICKGPILLNHLSGGTRVTCHGQIRTPKSRD
jgi:hypothetical protein